VVAGVASLGGEVTVAVRNSLLLECKSVGSPPPRTVWYHNQNIITHHPRFTRNRDDSLLIKSKSTFLSIEVKFKKQSKTFRLGGKSDRSEQPMASHLIHFFI
jgi:hypothetical protein